MSYVIYNKETTILHTVYRKGSYRKTESWKTASAAKAALTRAVRKGDILVAEDYAIAEVGDFKQNIEKMVERTNMMSGKKFQEPVNTPHYCSPAFESYWSM